MTPPILGIWASSFFQPTGDYQAIMTATVDASGSASIDFTSIPQTFKHLQIRALARLTGATLDDNILCRFNNDSGSNYAVHWLTGSGVSASANNIVPFTSMLTGRITGANSSASMYGVSVIDILDYANTNKNKTVRTLTGHDQNGSGSVWLESGLWLNTAAISTITLLSGSSFEQYSQFALYGVK